MWYLGYNRDLVCVNFATLIIWEIRVQCSDIILPLLSLKILFPSLPIPPLIFSYLQALIHGFLWQRTCSWLIFSLNWCLQSLFVLLYSTIIDLQEANDSIDGKDLRPTSSTLSYIRFDPLNRPQGFEPKIKSDHWVFMKLVFLCYRHNCKKLLHREMWIPNTHNHWTWCFNWRLRGVTLDTIACDVWCVTRLVWN